MLECLDNKSIGVFKLEKNMGAAFARNFGIKRAQGEFIAFLDDDDEYYPSFIELSLKALQSTGSSISVCSARHITPPTRSSSRPKICDMMFPNNTLDYEQLIHAFLKAGIGSGVLIKKSCFHHVGYFNTEFKFADDTDMFLRLLKNGYIPSLIPSVGIIVNNHQSSRLTGSSNHQTRIRECHRLMFDYKDIFDKYPVILRLFNLQIELLKSKIDMNA